MTPLQREILELCEVLIAADEAATPGPWHFVCGKADHKQGAFVAAVAPGHHIRDDPKRTGGTYPAADGKWIEISRNAAPRLARKVKEMLGE